MNLRKAQISIILVTLLVSGCFPPPEFPDVPNIRFSSLQYIDYETARDSMVLKFEFEDGDGDIGLTADEIRTPYHPFNIVIDSRDSVVRYADPDVVPPLYLVDPLGNVTPFSETDNRPPFNCSSYQVGNFTDIGTDTFYIQKNPYHNNLHIQFLRKKNGAYTKIDFASEFGNASCDVVDFNGRIPIFDRENIGRSLSGTISYAMLSAGFPIILRSDTFKVKFYIYDRDLNKSNEVESPDLTLSKITLSRD